MTTQEEIEIIQAEINQLSDQLQQAEQARNSITALMLQKAGALRALRSLEETKEEL